MKDAEIYPGKSLSDVFRDIHETTLTKRAKINDMIHELRKKISTVDDIVVLVPIIKDLLEVSVKNDDAMVKIATIVQRIIAVEAKEGSSDIDSLLSDEEKERILGQAKAELDKELAAIEEKTKLVLPPSGS